MSEWKGTQEWKQRRLQLFQRLKERGHHCSQFVGRVKPKEYGQRKIKKRIEE